MAKLTNNSTLQRLRNRYRLVVMNDDTYEEVVTFKLSRLSVYIGLSTAFVMMTSITILLIIYTPLKFYIPGYGSKQGKTELQVLKIRTDSLEQAIRYKEEYMESVRKALGGDTPVKLDTTVIDAPKGPHSNE